MQLWVLWERMKPLVHFVQCFMGVRRQYAQDLGVQGFVWAGGGEDDGGGDEEVGDEGDDGGGGGGDDDEDGTSWVMIGVDKKKNSSIAIFELIVFFP